MRQFKWIEWNLRKVDGTGYRDEQIAAEPSLAPLDLPPDGTPSPIEAHLGRHLRADGCGGNRGERTGTSS